ncbi:hypothetical protein FRC17_010120 [Serendipita sp. 399]|nr:hypothetical protein FRC17_010120 [Serendipita sp. 399]
MSSLQRKSNQEIMLNELNYRIARNSAFISICMSAVLAPLTHGSSLVSWMISVPQFAFNLYKTFRCKLERKRRHLERPSGSLAAAFVAPVAGTIGMFAGLGMDAIFDSLNSLTATDAANFAAPYNNGPPPPDQQVEQGVQVVESVIMAFGEEQISGMVEKALLANTVDTRYANLSAKSSLNGGVTAVSRKLSANDFNAYNVVFAVVVHTIWLAVLQYVIPVAKNHGNTECARCLANRLAGICAITVINKAHHIAIHCSELTLGH